MKRSDVDNRLSHVWLASFGDSRYIKARKRLREQALRFGFQEDHICFYDENDLSVDFRERMADKLVLGSRGYGYWCWKPEVALEAIRQIPDGDILLYLDMGCHLNPRGKERFLDYVRVAEKKGFCAFQCRSLLSNEVPLPHHHFYPTSEFTKGDMLDYYCVRENELITEAGQVEAGIFFMKRAPEAELFLSEWRDMFFNHFEMMDDSSSRSPNLPNYRVCRNDQSAFSIMWLLRRYPTFSSCEMEPMRRYLSLPSEYRHNSAWGHFLYAQMRQYPIFAKRDKGDLSFLQKVFRSSKYRIFLPLKRRMLGN